jgi:CheY-like chemotaxis protein/putative methionine-R-sulfoxide reductase with GAF domain
MQKIFEITVKQLNEFFGTKHFVIFRIDDVTTEMKLLYHSGFAGESIQGLRDLSAQRGIFRRVLHSQTPQVVYDLSQTEEELSALATNEELNSMIAVPIFSDQKLWGVLAAFSPETSGFTEEDGKIMSLFGGQIGLLLDFFFVYMQDNLDELLIQVLGSTELISLKIEDKKTVPASEILNAQKRLKQRIRSYVAGLEKEARESRISEPETEDEQIKLPSGDELSIEEVVTIQGNKDEPKAKQKKVLVIDDQAIVTELLVSVLERMNYQSVVASCGREGVEQFEKDEFDLVITDLGMPDISGWEVSKTVKQKNPNIPVVIITGWGVTPDPDEMREAKVDSVIHKPFQIDQLEKIIQDLLQK